MLPRLTIAQPAARVVDPHITSDRRAQLGIRFAVYDALVARDATGAFVPALASAWTVEPDARTWTFTIRRDVGFHSGEQLRAGHVVASVERVLGPGIGGELGTAGVIQSYLAGSEITATDEHTVRMVTPAPMADLLDLLVDLPIVSSALEGTGPYVVELTREGEVRMRAFSECWRGAPGAERLVWVAIPDDDARLAALEAGEVDLVTDVPARLAERARAVATVWESPSPTCVAFLCNCFNGPCTDPRVRRALNLAIDKAAIIRDIALGDGAPINGPLTELHLAHDPATPVFPFNPAAARTLLAESGYADGLELTVDVPTSLPEEAPALGHALAAAWSAIGVRTSVREHTDREGYAHMVREKRIGDAACFDSSPLSSFRVLREKLHSGVAGPWWQGYANPAVDELLDAAAGTPDPAARQSIYRQAYRLIHDDAPWVFLYRPVYRWAGKGDLPWRPSPAGWVEVLSGEC